MIETHQRFVCENVFTHIVFGRLERFYLVRVDDGEPIDAALMSEIHLAGVAFAGMFGLNTGGQAEVCLAPDNPHAWGTMLFAGPTYSRLAAERRIQLEDAGAVVCGPTEKGDSVDWLRKLYALPTDEAFLDSLHSLPDTR